MNPLSVRPRFLSLAMTVLVAACSPATTPSSDAGDSSGLGSTTGSEPDTTSSTETDAGGSGSSGASEVVEVEGWVEFVAGEINEATYFRDCGGTIGGCLEGDVHDLWHCNGTFARLRGYPVEAFQGLADDTCGGTAFHVTEVVESRLCRPGDCGCAEGLDCEDVCLSSDACPDGFECSPWSIPGGDDTH